MQQSVAAKPPTVWFMSVAGSTWRLEGGLLCICVGGGRVYGLRSMGQTFLRQPVWTQNWDWYEDHWINSCGQKFAYTNKSAETEGQKSISWLKVACRTALMYFKMDLRWAKKSENKKRLTKAKIKKLTRCNSSDIVATATPLTSLESLKHWWLNLHTLFLARVHIWGGVDDWKLLHMLNFSL